MPMEPAIPAHQQCPRTQTKRMPEGYEAPFPAWMARYTEGGGPFVMAYFGVQQLAALPPDALAPVEAMLAIEPAPGHWLRTQWHDGAGYDTRIAIAYWPDPAQFAQWRLASGFDAWWADPARESEPVGRFLEVVAPPADRMEVLYSTPDGIEGVGHLSSMVSDCPIAEHGYWGSARDRIAVSQTDTLDAGTERPARQGGGKRVTVVPHRNVCMIRSGQDWSDTHGEERDLYLGRVQPKLIAGMVFLRDQGQAIGCYSCRFMQVLDEAGAPIEKTFGQAYFHSLADLEAWAEHHPTHLAIFGTFIHTLAPLGADLRLRLFHEVMALPADAQAFEYVNCHPGTGLLAATER